MKESIVERVWNNSGLDCVVIFIHQRYRCGYVKLPKEHAAYGVDYSDIPVSVHGGLTYGEYKLIGYDETGDNYWVGFDCMHCGDCEISDERAGHYWTLKEVVKETNKLANQLSNLTIGDLVEAKLESLPEWFRDYVNEAEL